MAQPGSRVARVCPHCDDGHVGDERHLNFECPALEHVWRRHGQIYAKIQVQHASVMWHKDLKAVASCLLQLHFEYASLSDALLT